MCFPNTSFIAEEILKLCIPWMTAELQRNVEACTRLMERAQNIVQTAPERGSLGKQWAAYRLAAEAHTAYCDVIEYDERISSARKGEAAERWLSLEVERMELEALSERVQEALSILIDECARCRDVAIRRLQEHLRCRASVGTMHHLPAFECSAASNNGNVRWRPVQSALLFSADELKSREAADEQRAMDMARSAFSTHPTRPDMNSFLAPLIRHVTEFHGLDGIELLTHDDVTAALLHEVFIASESGALDEVLYVQGVLRSVMQTSTISKAQFERIFVVCASTL